MAPSTVPSELRSTWYAKTFADVTELVLSTVCTVTPHVNRVDNYVQMSIKDTVRECRNKTPGRCVNSTSW